MKLPEEVEAKLDSHCNTYEWEHIEAIVRDCAKVCSTKAESVYDHAKGPYIDMKTAILARYGLTEKKGE